MFWQENKISPTSVWKMASSKKTKGNHLCRVLLLNPEEQHPSKVLSQQQ